MSESREINCIYILTFSDAKRPFMCVVCAGAVASRQTLRTWCPVWTYQLDTTFSIEMMKVLIFNRIHVYALWSMWPYIYKINLLLSSILQLKYWCPANVPVVYPSKTPFYLHSVTKYVTLGVTDDKSLRAYLMARWWLYMATLPVTLPYILVSHDRRCARGWPNT